MHTVTAVALTFAILIGLASIDRALKARKRRKMFRVQEVKRKQYLMAFCAMSSGDFSTDGADEAYKQSVDEAKANPALHAFLSIALEFRASFIADMPPELSEENKAALVAWEKIDPTWGAAMSRAITWANENALAALMVKRAKAKASAQIEAEAEAAEAQEAQA